MNLPEPSGVYCSFFSSKVHHRFSQDELLWIVTQCWKSITCPLSGIQESLFFSFYFLPPCMNTQWGQRFYKVVNFVTLQNRFLWENNQRDTTMHTDTWVYKNSKHKFCDFASKHALWCKNRSSLYKNCHWWWKSTNWAFLRPVWHLPLWWLYYRKPSFSMFLF